MTNMKLFLIEIEEECIMKLVVFVTEFGNYYYSISHPKARVIRSSNFAGCIGSNEGFIL